MDTPRYESPKVIDHGSLQELTAQTGEGAVLDATIVAGTPVTELPGIIANSLS